MWLSVPVTLISIMLIVYLHILWRHNFYRANIIFTAKIIAHFVDDIGTVKIVVEYLHYMVKMQ